MEVIRQENTYLNDFDLTCSEDKNDQQKDQVSEISQLNNSWLEEIRRKEKEKVITKRDVTNPANLVAVEKKGLKVTDDMCSQTEVMNCRTLLPVENKALSPNGARECKVEKNEEQFARRHEKQTEKMKSSEQNSKNLFRNSSLKLRIPPRNKKNVEENASPQRHKSITDDETGTTSVEKTRARSDDKHKPDSNSPSSGTVPVIKIIRNSGDLARDHQVRHASERLSPTTENFITTQRPFSAHSHSVGSPTIPRRLICGRPRSSTLERDRCSSHSPPRASLPAGFCFPHPPADSPLSSRRRSWSPSMDLVAKISPILQRKFGSAYADLERPRSGSKIMDISNQTTLGPEGTTLTAVDYKLFESLRQDLPVQSMSAPSSPQSPRKLLSLKINQELEELHHRFFSTRAARAKTLNHRRGSLPGNTRNEDAISKNKDEKWKKSLDSGHKQGKPFYIWLKEKEEQTTRKHAFELAATKAVEKLADQTWSEILSHGKTYEKWRREKEQTKCHIDFNSAGHDHIEHGECHKKGMKYEEWLKKKDEEDLKREEVMRQEAEIHFEETRRKKELENEKKIAKLKKHDN